MRWNLNIGEQSPRDLFRRDTGLIQRVRGGSRAGLFGRYRGGLDRLRRGFSRSQFLQGQRLRFDRLGGGRSTFVGRGRAFTAQNRLWLTLASLGLGAGLTYLLDPQRGARRRAIAADKTGRAFRKGARAADITGRDLRNRARGVFRQVGTLFRDEEITDDRLVARVRAQLGRVVSHPKAIKVSASQGRVTLSGPILSYEVNRLLPIVARVKGVTHVENRLELHRDSAGIPALQGGRQRQRGDVAFGVGRGAPAGRLIGGMTGGGLVYAGRRLGGPLGWLSSILGVGLVARALTGLDVGRLLGTRGRNAITFEKGIHISAPVEQVFNFWSRFENFPQFMTNVREVRDHGEGRSHWVVAGPAGIPVEWDAVITRFVPNKLLAWKSVRGSLVRNAGIIHFAPDRDGGTHIHVRLTYSPPVGALGHTVATLFGVDPKHEMDQDLLRLKTALETGKRPRDAAQGRAGEQSPLQPGATH